MQSAGKRQLRMFIMKKNKKLVSGTLSVHQLEGDSMAPMLLSSVAQGILGISKDSRTGIVLIEGDEVEVFRMKGTGLRALCISGGPDGEPYAEVRINEEPEPYMNLTF